MKNLRRPSKIFHNLRFQSPPEISNVITIGNITAGPADFGCARIDLPMSSDFSISASIFRWPLKDVAAGVTHPVAARRSAVRVSSYPLVLHGTLALARVFFHLCPSPFRGAARSQER